MFVEINLSKNKWLLSFSYNPQKSEIRKHLGAAGKNLSSIHQGMKTLKMLWLNL